ncbi:MAG TPA: phosphatase PAP2 family protein, partial [Anaerolineae bacterium]
VGAVVFGLLLWNLTANGPLLPWDAAAVAWFHAWATHSSPFMKWLMLTGSFIGQNGVIYLGVALGVFWIVNRQWHKVAMLVLGVGGCEAAYQILGGIIGRHRPVFPDPLEVLTGPGFPSGHTSAGLAFFGLLAYLLWPHLKTRWSKVAVVALVTGLLLYISVSRLFQGVHYPTDLLSGFALGLAWSGLIYTPLEAASRGVG